MKLGGLFLGHPVYFTLRLTEKSPISEVTHRCIESDFQAGSVAAVRHVNLLFCHKSSYVCIFGCTYDRRHIQLATVGRLRSR